jgi:putative tricarboxylic transport membrane protein
MTDNLAPPTRTTRRQIIKTALASGAALAMPTVLTGSAWAAGDYPRKPITLLCHTAPGSAADIYARELASAIEPVLGQPVVVVNRVGGNGVVQMAALASAPADGYTLGVNTVSHLSVLHTAGKNTYRLDDFAWIARVQLEGFFTVVRADSPWQTLKDLVEHAKSAKTLVNVGGQGAPGSAHNVHFHLLADAAGFKFNWIPFAGGIEHLTALLGGTLDVTSNNPQTIVQFAEAKRIRALGYQGEERLAAFPDVPTYREAGFDVDPSWQQIRGVFGRKGLPVEIQQRLALAIEQGTAASQSWQSYMKNSNLAPGFLGPEAYTGFIAKQDALTLSWLKKLGLVA